MEQSEAETQQQTARAKRSDGNWEITRAHANLGTAKSLAGLARLKRAKTHYYVLIIRGARI